MKASLKIYRLYFNSPLHISDVRADYSNSEQVIHSDTICAAIMQAWACLGKDEWITGNPGFTLSSMFPFTQDEDKNKVYFFRKPYFLPISVDRVNKAGDSKKYKRVQYIDASFFEKLLNGEFDATVNDAKGPYLTASSIDDEFIKSKVAPRIRWHRDEAEDAEPFYMERLYFKQGSGLWFACEGNKQDDARVESALRFLSDAGLGTDRNVGNGRFSFENDKLELRIPEESNYCINLSLYCPASVGVLKTMVEGARGYDFIRRGGWIGEPYNTYRKRSVHMFSEGSVFSRKTQGIESDGITHDLRPMETPVKVRHPVYRVGKALFLPMKCL